MDPKLMDENLIDRLHWPLTKTIHYYLDKLRSIDQSINDMQHITEPYIYILIILTRNVTNEFVDTKGVIKINENYVKKKFVRSHGSGIYNYLCNQCLSPLMLLVNFKVLH
jgi:hypothetical protein